MPSRITNSENPPVAGQQNPVAGQPGLSATKTKESQSSQSHSEQGPSQINVVSISADVEVKNRLLKVFGPGLMPSAQRLATFLQCDVQSALGTMDAYQGSVSPGVVLNAIAKLDLNAMHKGHPIQDRAKWFEKGIGFAKTDADGAWLEAPKKERRDRPMRNGYPVNSDGKNIFEMFGYDTPTGGAG